MHQHINITLIACSVLYLHNDPSIAYSWSIVNIRTINCVNLCCVLGNVKLPSSKNKTTSTNGIQIKETTGKHKLQQGNTKH